MSAPQNDPCNASCPIAAAQPQHVPPRCPSQRSCPTNPCVAGPSSCCVPVIEQATATVLTNIRVQRRLRCDPCYLKTKPGALKFLQIVVLIVGLVAAHFYKELLKPFGYTAMVGLAITILLLTLYLIHFIEKYYTIPWLHLELLFNLAAAIAFGGLAVWLITRGVYPVAAASLVAFLLYAYDTVLKWIGVRNYAIAQGERTVVTKTTHFSGPACNVPPLTSSMINIPPIQICTSSAKAKAKAPAGGSGQASPSPGPPRTPGGATPGGTTPGTATPSPGPPRTPGSVREK